MYIVGVEVAFSWLLNRELAIEHTYFLVFIVYFLLVLASYAGEDKESLCDSLVRNTIAVYNTVITQVRTL